MEAQKPLLLFDIDETLVCPVRLDHVGVKKIKELIQFDLDRSSQDMLESLVEGYAHSVSTDEPQRLFALGLMIETHNKAEPLQCKLLDLESDFSDVIYVVFLRPYLIQFLSKLHINQQYDLGVFSTGSEMYVSALLSKISQYVKASIENSGIDPHQVSLLNEVPLFRIVKHKEHAVEDESLGDFVKDLSVVEGYNLGNIILIDNKCLNFSANVLNGIPVRPFNIFSMEQREFDKRPFKYDLQLKRLEQYLHTFDPSESLVSQNVFIFKGSSAQSASDRRGLN